MIRCAVSRCLCRYISLVNEWVKCQLQTSLHVRRQNLSCTNKFLNCIFVPFFNSNYFVVFIWWKWGWLSWFWHSVWPLELQHRLRCQTGLMAAKWRILGVRLQQCILGTRLYLHQRFKNAWYAVFMNPVASFPNCFKSSLQGLQMEKIPMNLQEVFWMVHAVSKEAFLHKNIIIFSKNSIFHRSRCFFRFFLLTILSSSYDRIWSIQPQRVA